MKDIAWEAVEAAQCHADIIYIDSGNPEDLKAVSKALEKKEQTSRKRGFEKASMMAS